MKGRARVNHFARGHLVELSRGHLVKRLGRTPLLGQGHVFWKHFQRSDQAITANGIPPLGTTGTGDRVMGSNPRTSDPEKIHYGAAKASGLPEP